MDADMPWGTGKVPVVDAWWYIYVCYRFLKYLIEA
jgi:hypothetical protein